MYLADSGVKQQLVQQVGSIIPRPCTTDLADIYLELARRKLECCTRSPKTNCRGFHTTCEVERSKPMGEK